MKKILLGVTCVLVGLGAMAFLFREPLLEFAKDRMTADMYVAEDTDTFNPGLPIGQTFPKIEALLDGQPIRDLSDLPIDKGVVFVANRSVDW